jgi:hypothetical protein
MIKENENTKMNEEIKIQNSINEEIQKTEIISIHNVENYTSKIDLNFSYDNNLNDEAEKLLKIFNNELSKNISNFFNQNNNNILLLINNKKWQKNL